MPENSDPKTNLSPKPLNPEMEAVNINQPTPAKVAVSGKSVSSAPKMMAKEKRQPSKKNFVLGCFGGLVFLFVLFIVLMVLLISRSGASNPVMKAFSLDPAGVRNFLQLVIGSVFGTLSILFLVLAVVGLFRLLGAQKSDKERRNSGMKSIFINTILLVLIVSLWVVLANYIGKVEISTERVVAEIVVVEPQDISHLTAPVEIRFSAINVAKALEMGGVKIAGMNWDLDGDGAFETPVTSPEVTHLYSQKGTYNVALQVKVAGEDKYRDPYVQTISIPDAAFLAEPESGVPPLSVQFDASGIVSKSNVASLDWDFENDGIYDLQGPDNLKPQHTFTQIGTYKVHLRAVDKSNNVENYYRNIQVNTSDKPLVSALFNVTPGMKGMAPFQVRLDASRSQSLKGSLVKYQWDFGDGSDLQLGESVSHVYTNSGSYSMTLHVEDDLGNKSEITGQIEVQAVSVAPQALITTTPAYKMGEALTGTLPFKVDFDASASASADNDIVKYEWDFNGDEVADEEGKKITHTFDKVGTSTVSLRIEDSKGQSGKASMQVTVQEPGILALINAAPEEGTIPLTVSLDGSSSSAYNGKIVSYEWDFGDSTPKTITGATISHKYTAVGTYTIKLKVVSDKNESASASKLIYVREIPLGACFSPSRKDGLAPLTVTFDSKCSMGALSSYHWTFGDGAESKLSSPTHTFDSPGSYSVTLEVTDSKSNVSTYQDVIVAQGELK